MTAGSTGRLGLAAAGGLFVLASSAGAAVPLGFHSVTPCRAIDTRSATGGAPALIAGATRAFVVVGHCGIPSDAKVLSLTVTVTAPTASGLLVLYPGGSSVPLVSTINYSAGQTRANNASVALGPAGDLQVASFQGGGTAHLIVDVNGYYEAPGCSEIPNVGAILVSPRPAARYADQVNAVHRALNPLCIVNSACPIAMQANAYRIAFAQKFRDLFPDVCAGIQTDAGVLVDEVCIGSKTECQGYHVFVCKAPPAGGCPPGNPDCGCDSGSAAWAPGSVRDTWRLPTAASCLPCPPLGKVEVKQIGVARVVFDSTPKTCDDQGWNQQCSTGRTCSPGGVEGDPQRAQCEAAWGPYSWSIGGQDCLATGACFVNGGNPLQVVVAAPVPHAQTIRMTGGNGIFGEAAIP
jgi:hypothetical protein